jgi:BON domain
MRLPCLLLALVAIAGPCAAQGEAERRNWFNDPFFQISASIPNCPLPAGPFITEAERRAESHHRAEKGTTCWLAGNCERPNAYDYDKDIAAALQAALARRNPFADTTLWVTVQGRVVYFEGCAASQSVAAELETFARKLPYVQQAAANVRTGSSARAPYKLRSDR